MIGVSEILLTFGVLLLLIFIILFLKIIYNSKKK